jgi:hypothetical protein
MRKSEVRHREQIGDEGKRRVPMRGGVLGEGDEIVWESEKEDGRNLHKGRTGLEQLRWLVGCRQH